MPSDDPQQDANDELRVELNVQWTKAYPAVFAFIRASVRDFHSSEDIMQEVAAAVARSFDTYDRTRSFRAWVFGIARNKVLMHLRSKTTDRHVFDDQTVEALAAASEQSSDLAHSARREALAACLGRVSGRARKFLDMRYAEGNSVASIAKSVGTTSNAVSLVLHRIRLSLKECVEHKLVDHSSPRSN